MPNRTHSHYTFNQSVCPVLFRACIGFFVFLISLVASQSAFALDEVYSPNVEYRELSLEYNGSRTIDSNPDMNNAQQHELVLEAGITPNWTVETSSGFAKDPHSNIKTESIEVESRFQFFETGENWLDAGLLVAYDFSTQGQQADSLELKMLLQKDFGEITNTANVGFSQNVGRYSSSGGPDYSLLWNSRYRYNEYFQPGIEIQSDLGQAHDLGHFSQQDHYIGLASYGRIFGHLKYQAGYFVGVSNAAAQNAARLLLEYEMHF